MDLPAVRIGPQLAVPIDIERVAAGMTFDQPAREAHVSATVEFVAGGHDGCPVLDLRQPAVSKVTLDGRRLPPEALAHHDLGGGPRSEMIVIDQKLPAGSRHRLELEYQLQTPDAEGAVPVGWDEGVRFDFWMSDLYPGRYLEMWLPANLCHDRFALTLEIGVAGRQEHTVITNGHQQDKAPNRWQVDYPAHFTSLSPMLVLAPTEQVASRNRQLTLGDRTLELRTAKVPEAEADLAACEADIAAWLVHDNERYGRWTHQDRFTAVLWGPGRGMEYDGATTAAEGALEHEVFHSWFGRGIKPEKASDGWIDEAWTSWATNSRRRQLGRFAVEELGLEEAPVLLYPPSPWSRHTPIESYQEGSRLFAGIAFLLGGAPQMREAMAQWYQANKGGLVTTADLEHVLSERNADVAALFARYVHGEEGRE